jgi:hypothetical protein
MKIQFRLFVKMDFFCSLVGFVHPFLQAYISIDDASAYKHVLDVLPSCVCFLYYALKFRTNEHDDHKDTRIRRVYVCS